MLQELRFCIRTLRKTPAFTVVVVLTLALGVGANTAIFSVVNAVLLNPAGVSHPDRVLSVRTKYDKLNIKSLFLSIPDFADLRASKKIFENVAVIDPWDFNFAGTSGPERLQGALVSSQYFDVFGARPQLGRIFRVEEDQPNANQEVVLSHAAWERLFGGDAGVLAKTLDLNGKLYRVIGVMRPDFRWPTGVDLWIPLGLAAADFQEDHRFYENYDTVARLKPGVSLQQANSFLRILESRVRNNAESGTYAKNAGWSLFAIPVVDFVAGDTKKPLIILLTAVGFVLLIACANIAGLMLARASGRSREVAVRAALGAGKWDLIRQIGLESMVLSGTGALVGLGLCGEAIRILLALAPQNVAAGLDVATDWHVLAFTAALTICAGVLFSIAPALDGLRAGNYSALKEGRSNTAGLNKQRTRAMLVVGEIALALVLLIGSGLFLRSLSRLQHAGTGFDPQGVLTAAVSLPESRYKEPGARIAFYRAVSERLSQIPGVTSAAAAFPLPFTNTQNSGSFEIEGRTLRPEDPGPHADMRRVTPGYFKTLIIPQRSGRPFTDQDHVGSEPVVVIDENLARDYWPHENPVGKHIRRGSSDPWARVLGVVGHVKNSDIAGDSGKGVVYFSSFQVPPPITSFALRTTADPASMTAAMREAVKSVDPTLPVHHIKTMQDMVSASLAPRRFVVSVLSFFAFVALLMAALGLYGIINYSVAQRTQEIGIRMALGAQRREVLSMIAGQALRLAASGVGIGFVSAILLSRLISSQLFETSAFDPLTFILTSIVLVAAAFLASYVPARRAAKVDPMVALRYE